MTLKQVERLITSVKTKVNVRFESSPTTMKLNNKQKSKIRREVDLELQVNTPKSSVFVNKKKYNRKEKHKNYDKRTKN